MREFRCRQNCISCWAAPSDVQTWILFLSRVVDKRLCLFIIIDTDDALGKECHIQYSNPVREGGCHRVQIQGSSPVPSIFQDGRGRWLGQNPASSHHTNRISLARRDTTLVQRLSYKCSRSNTTATTQVAASIFHFWLRPGFWVGYTMIAVPCRESEAVRSSRKSELG